MKCHGFFTTFTPKDKKRCVEKTKDGTRCSRWAVIEIGDRRSTRHCKQHSAISIAKSQALRWCT
jgi:hypothetical protein